MSTINWLKFRNFDSRDHNLFVRKKNVFDAAESDLTFVSVPGRDGDVIMKNGRHKNIPIVYELSFFSTQFKEISENENFFYSLEDVKRTLIEDGNYYNLYDSYVPGYYRKACLIKGLSVKQPHWSVGEFSLNFNCKPFRYQINGDKMQTITVQNTQIYNPEAYESLPYIKIYGSGNVGFVVNGSVYDFKNVSGYIECDSDMMNVYKGTTNKNDDFLPNRYPKLVSGNNTISWNGDVSRIDIIPRWRTR